VSVCHVKYFKESICQNTNHFCVLIVIMLNSNIVFSIKDSEIGKDKHPCYLVKFTVLKWLKETSLHIQLVRRTNCNWCGVQFEYATTWD